MGSVVNKSGKETGTEVLSCGKLCSLVSGAFDGGVSCAVTRACVGRLLGRD